MNAPFVIDQAVAITQADGFQRCETDEARVSYLFDTVFQRTADPLELTRITRFVELQERFFAEPLKRESKVKSPWPLVSQALLMSNEFQYVD